MFIEAETLEQRLRNSPRERVAAWALTGPLGRAWSFAIDLGAVLAALARHGVLRLRARLGGREA